MRNIILVLFLCVFLTSCSFVKGRDHIVSLQDYERNMLEMAFDIELTDNTLTDEEYDALLAYRAGANFILDSYYLDDLSIKSFSKVSDEVYKISFSCYDIDMLCEIIYNGEEYDYIVHEEQ